VVIRNQGWQRKNSIHRNHNYSKHGECTEISRSKEEIFNHAGHYSQSSHGLVEIGAQTVSEKSPDALPAASTADQPGVDSRDPQSKQRRNFSNAGLSLDPVEPLFASFNNSEEISAALEGRGYINTLQIETVPRSDGFNSGRTCYMRAAAESTCWRIVDELSVVLQKAKKRCRPERTS
jgi:hypothetical protein